VFYNPFKYLSKREWVLWIVSLVTVLLSNMFLKDADIVTLVGTVVGVTALIFVAKGDVWGQFLTVVFSFLYAATSFEMKYYGEMITYLGMSMPIAAMSVVSWLKHPYKGRKNEVEIQKMTKKQTVFMIVSCLLVTFVFFFLLKALSNGSLAVSTISVTTSYLASFLMFYRNPFYALAYAANDIVLIVLWVIASVKDMSYLPMVICFTMFFVNDIYGFISWKKREVEQAK